MQPFNKSIIECHDLQLFESDRASNQSSKISKLTTLASKSTSASLSLSDDELEINVVRLADVTVSARIEIQLFHISNSFSSFYLDLMIHFLQFDVEQVKSVVLHFHHSNYSNDLYSVLEHQILLYSWFFIDANFNQF